MRMKVDTKLDPPIDERTRITATYPDFGAAVGACVTATAAPRAP
jgi:hypothetical protein